jgi:hypothetical protein
MADLASGAESKGVMAARVTLRTKILMAAGFVYSQEALWRYGGLRAVHPDRSRISVPLNAAKLDVDIRCYPRTHQ